MAVTVLDKPTLHEAPDNGVALPRAIGSLLRVPLLTKLLGANGLLLVAAIIAHELMPSGSAWLQAWVTLALSFGVSTLLVWLALRPLAELEAAADQVSAGDFTARVPASPLADRDMLKLAGTMNRLLNRVETDRTRIQYLAGRAVRARDIEREAVARELRDSLAQMVSGAALQLTAARRANTDPVVEAQLRETNEVINQVTEEMRLIAEALYPGTLGEFGLRNALETLARRISRRGRLQVDIDLGVLDVPISPQGARALYRVADEALRNIAQHADARHARVILRTNGHAVLEIEDDGRGMDLRSRDPVQAGLGLFSARAVLALAGGDLQISSAPGLGTRVVARVPVFEADNES